MTAEPGVEPDGCVMPSWRWDEKAGILQPVCPKCKKRLMVSGSKMTCVIFGYSHFHEPTNRVVAAALGRLT